MVLTLFINLLLLHDIICTFSTDTTESEAITTEKWTVSGDQSKDV